MFCIIFPIFQIIKIKKKKMLDFRTKNCITCHVHENRWSIRYLPCLLSVLFTIYVPLFQSQRSCSIYLNMLHSNKWIRIAFILFLTLTFYYDLHFIVPHFSLASILKELVKICLLKIHIKICIAVLKCVTVYWSWPFIRPWLH